MLLKVHQFHVTPNSIGVIRGGKYQSRSDFGIELKFFVEAGDDTGFVAEVTTSHMSTKTRLLSIFFTCSCCI